MGECNDYPNGCCADGITPAPNANQVGCAPVSTNPRGVCSSTEFGCCPDGFSIKKTSTGENCPVPGSTCKDCSVPPVKKCVCTCCSKAEEAAKKAGAPAPKAPLPFTPLIHEDCCSTPKENAAAPCSQWVPGCQEKLNGIFEKIHEGHYFTMDDPNLV